MNNIIENTLLTVREVQVFRIPPRQSNRGYRASDWDVNQFLWKGRLRVVSKGDACLIKFEDANTGQLFAQCRHEADGSTVEQVMDSSRYFVVKVEDNNDDNAVQTKRHAFLGVGFQERNDSFDFNVALQDHFKKLKSQQETEKRRLNPSEQAAVAVVDYSLKEGQQISINIGNLAKKKAPTPLNDGTFTANPTNSGNNSKPTDWVQF